MGTRMSRLPRNREKRMGKDRRIHRGGDGAEGCRMRMGWVVHHGCGLRLEDCVNRSVPFHQEGDIAEMDDDGATLVLVIPKEG